MSNVAPGWSALVPRPPRGRLWFFVLMAYWVLGAVGAAVLPWTLLILPTALASPTSGPFGSEASFILGSIALGWLLILPVAIPVGIMLGLAAAAGTYATGLWTPARRRHRWWRYLGVLVAAYGAVVVAVRLMYPTAAHPVATYAVCAAVLAVASCPLLALLELRGEGRAAPWSRAGHPLR